jgi:hypothetical protein
MTPLQAYVADAIRRIQAGEVTGSHATGVFNKAANGFEKLFRRYFQVVTGRPPGALTLGALIRELESLPGSQQSQLAAINIEVRTVNRPWTEVKHGAEPPIKQLLSGLRAMERCIPLL